MGLRDFKIGTRLGMGFGIILLILTAMVAMVNYLNYQNKATLMYGLDLATTKNLQAAAMKSAMLETGIAMRNIGLLSDVSLMQKEAGEVKKQRDRNDTAFKKMQVLGLDDAETKVLADIAALDKDVGAAFKESIGMALAFNTEGAAKVIFSRIDPLNQQALVSINNLVEMQQMATRRVLDKSVEADKRLMMWMFALGAIALAFGAACGLIITRSITRPLHGAVGVARKVAAGELTSRVKVVGRDETSELLQALKDMNESLAATVGEVRAGTETITVAAKEIAAGNSDLSVRTESQASSLEETASSMEELTSTVRQNADNARHANQLAVTAYSVAEKGRTVVSQVVATMGSIKESSRKVADIIAVIDGIAFQTNILALNAAVEAARAGEQGRGFAVVASEVRNLAQRSAGAAKEIKALIGDSVGEVDAGNKLVDEAGHTMGLVVTSIRQVADIMGEITAATQEQSAGIEEVNKAVTQMDEMTQQNAALVEQAAAAAESMEEQAQKLSASVSVFKLSDDSQRVATRPPLRAAAVLPRTLPAARVGRETPTASKKLLVAANAEWEEF